MPLHPPSGKSDLAKLVERQMRNWELSRAQQPAQAAQTPAAEVAPFVAISRMKAAGGSRIGGLLGERLGWPVFDREILQAMAGDDQVRTRIYEHWDERDTSWLEATMRWLMRGELERDDYFVRLSETVLALARQGPGVFLGRASDLLLPVTRGLRVRVVAALERRAATLAQRQGMTEALARAELERLDAERADFRRRHFGRGANDVTCYDLVLNMDGFTPEAAVEVIATALRLRGILP